MRRTLIVWVLVLSGTGVVFAEGAAGHAALDGAAETFGAVRANLSEEEVLRLLQATHDALAPHAEAAGIERSVDGDPPFCAFVSGSSGTARLGGGGPLRSFQPDAVPVGSWSAVGALQQSLVIVDDFGAGPFGHRVVREPDWSTLSGLEATGNEATDMGRLRAAVFGAAASIHADHGSIVLFHTLGMLLSGGAEVASVDRVDTGRAPTGATNHRVTRIEFGAGAPVIVVSFDFLELPSLRQAMEGVDALLRPEPATYNLSWNLADCFVLEVFRATRANLDDGAPELMYRAFMRALIGDDESVRNDVVAVCEAVLGRIGADPEACAHPDALELVVHASESRRAEASVMSMEISPFTTRSDGATLVSAAGNESLPFPLAPAAWRCVIGVAAYEHGTPDRRADWSNLGDFIAAEDETSLGAYFSTGIPGLDEGAFLFYGGTSFAAPVVSAGIASGARPGLEPNCAY